ncbi:MAG: glycosyltransferase [Saprospiraceae bacterium]|nr:glycosyltransferase [Saprospiraceae bacterium]MCB9321340.1 glycosyltransferase [Lewinellaceae bacterium]
MDWWTWAGYILVGFYALALFYVLVFCLSQLHLLWLYSRHHHRPSEATPPPPNKWPPVTVQLPIYNEIYVVERLIRNIMLLDYPKELLEVQILDDSTDDTTEIITRVVREYQAQGFHIRHIRRPDRQGYKAGALQYGLEEASGEFIAIFDADFLPTPDFLKRTIPWFSDPRTGVVQTRWEHLNESYSLITALQAFQLNVHFSVEQTGRLEGQYLLQFNGTGGIWRRQTILDAGGWQPDTLTEDLDLSYRSQLRGWKIQYLEKLGSPAELPAEMNGLKSQQHRWMKGGAETAKKNLPHVWRSTLPLGKKIHATLHLMASAIFVFVFLIGVFSVPVLFLTRFLEINIHYFAWFLTGMLAIVAVYFAGNVTTGWSKGSWGKKALKFLVLFPVFLSLSMGLSLHNSVAVIQGWLGRKSSFVRTPKFNIRTITDTFRNHRYLARSISRLTVWEGVMAVYFLAAVVMGIYYGFTSFVIFHGMLAFGYGMIFYYSLRHLEVK